MKLSIIIPVYNEINRLERFTNNLLNSFNNQNVEYIFVNDGSADGSTEWLINFKKNYLSKYSKNNIILINLNSRIMIHKTLLKITFHNIAGTLI